MIRIKSELNLPVNSILLLSVGELNENKNQQVIIKALAELPDYIHYIICGQGELKDELLSLAEELNISTRLHLLGYRNDIYSVMKSCDIFVFPSKREGLPVSLMEAMVCGLPCVVSDVRGNRDLIMDGINGYLCHNNLEKEYKTNLTLLLNNPTLMKQTNDMKIIKKKVRNIYYEFS